MGTIWMPPRPNVVGNNDDGTQAEIELVEWELSELIGLMGFDSSTVRERRLVL